MRIQLTICCTLVSSFVFGQFAIISDKDGYSNVRSSADITNNIISKLSNGHLVYSFETNGNWTNIDYTKSKKELNGHIYKDRLILISSYQVIPVQANEKSQVVLEKDSIKVIVSAQPFDITKHKLTFNKEYKDQLASIDNQRFWGTDGRIPDLQYKTIEIRLGKKKLSLPPAALNSLYEVTLVNTQAHYDEKHDILYIQSMNSDGAGGYEVIWKIEKGVYKERYVAYGF